MKGKCLLIVGGGLAVIALYAVMSGAKIALPFAMEYPAYVYRPGYIPRHPWGWASGAPSGWSSERGVL